MYPAPAWEEDGEESQQSRCMEEGYWSLFFSLLCCGILSFVLFKKKFILLFAQASSCSQSMRLALRLGPIRYWTGRKTVFTLTLERLESEGQWRERRREGEWVRCRKQERGRTPEVKRHPQDDALLKRKARAFCLNLQALCHTLKHAKGK